MVPLLLPYLQEPNISTPFYFLNKWTALAAYGNL
jgi:hypothetical protein